MNKFFKGTLLLAVAAFAGEIIEFIVNMVLARELGERGLGLYMSILPTIFLIVLLASFELPIAISKFIAEKDKKYHYSMLNHVIKLTVLFTVILLPLAIMIIPFISVFDQYHPYLRWVVIAFIPIVSFSSITRGFFMGKQQMGKIATYNLVRKLVQLLLLVFLYQFFQFDMETAVFIAFCTFIGSEIIVFFYLLHMFILQFQQVKRAPSERISGSSVRKSLLAVSVPTTALRVFHALTHAIEPFLIKAALLRAGVSGVVATEHFGMLAGIAMTIGFFPAFIAHSFLIMLIPTVSEAYAEKNHEKLQSLLQQVFIITCLYGIPAVILFYFFAEPLTLNFFHSTDAAIYLQLLWPFFLLHYFIIPMQAFLIGLGLMKEAFYHFVWSTIVSFSVMYVLGSMHSFQMDGIIIGMNAGALILFLMHYLTICKKIGVNLLLSPEKNFQS
ncbi:polysaccharide biosynthesis protein [Bacillus sp. S/N-304-OC-R1]|uniref:polysaccharide biosynthesis protein n=1 Tax=Bacillus sp. S/N-304-OC-R1 TaxID=2758034 RepID=UPI001C8E459B|nr:polysaccharide biosynthesis protein [Bacillus sp. S/N-304-OC-R1]MBY0122991.1 polysaccharide biosynthesis protein [Bacillus sp. S/N-304-OC-R1]